MATIEEALNTAIRHHQAGQLAEAETIYRRILDVQPAHATALHLLGTLCLQQKNADQAIHFLEQATAHAPSNPDGLNNLGGAYQAAGRWQDSVSVLQKALQIAPDNPKFHFDLGNSFKALDRPVDAIRCFETAIRLNPSFIQAINNLGTTLTGVGRLEEAIRTLHSALAIKPDYANAQNGLGNALLDSGRADEALEWLKKAAALGPGQAKFHCNLGVALKATGHPEAAYQAYQRALQLQPSMIEARKNLGNLFVSQQRTADAVREFEAAAEICPNDVEIRVAIGDGYRDLEDFEHARHSYDKAATLRPQDDWLKLKNAFLFPSVFRSAEQIAQYRDAFLKELRQTPTTPLKPADVESKGLMPPFALTYHGLDDRPIKAAVANLYSASFPEAEAAARSSVSSKPKIGFVVTNGHEGIFVRCMAGIVDRLDRERFEVLIIAPTVAARFIRGELSNDQTQYVELPERFHRMLEPIRRAAPDVLYFWECGTDLFNYFLPLARMAPLQCTGWGLPVTSGIPAMDFCLSNKLVEPPDADSHYCETLIRAETFLTWQKPVNMPATLKPRSDFGYANDQHLYLCAQNLMKIHPDFDEVMAGILRSDAAGRIILVQDKRSRLQQQLEERFAKTVPDVADRIEFRPRMDFDDYISLVSAADVALDPLHYGSGITAYDIFCCGTPLVTLPTEFRRGRFVSACYTKMGLDSCTARDKADYIRIACELAESDDLRTTLSAAIRDRRSALFNDKSAVTAFEGTIELMLSTKR